MAFPLDTANGPVTVTTHINADTQSMTPPFYQMFLKGQPKALGAIQIPLGCVQFAVETIVLCTLSSFTSNVAWSFIGYWGGIFYIISGSLAVAAAAKASHCLIRGALATNAISAVVSILEIGLAISDLFLTYYNIYGPCYTQPCSLYQDAIYVIQVISNILLIFIAAFQFCVTVSLLVFSIRSLKEKSQNVQQGLIVQTDNPNSMAIPPVSTAPVSTEVTNNSDPLPAQNH